MYVCTLVYLGIVDVSVSAPLANQLTPFHKHRGLIF